jgi:hypothetical protein
MAVLLDPRSVLPRCFELPIQRFNISQGDVQAKVTLKDYIQSPLQPDSQLLLTLI